MSSDEASQALSTIGLVDCSENGSNKLANIDESEPYRVWRADGAVKIRTTTKPPASYPVVSVPVFFATTVKDIGDKTAYGSQENLTAPWKTITFYEYWNLAWKTAKAFIALGLETFHGVCIMGSNSLEWVLSDMAGILAGSLSAGIYATNSPAIVRHVLRKSSANLIVVDTVPQLKKVAEIYTPEDLPCLKAVVLIKEDPENSVSIPNLRIINGWENIYSFSRGISDSVLAKRINAQAANQCCTLIFTSGTTGNPKGVMVSHDNVIWTTKCMAEQLKFPDFSKFVSFLPASHIAGQILDIFGPLATKGSVYFGQPDALRGSLVATLRQVKPTIFFGVPRVWEKFQAALEQVFGLADDPDVIPKEIEGKIYHWALERLRAAAFARRDRKPIPFGAGIAEGIVGKKAKAFLGLENCELYMTGAAPTSVQTLSMLLGHGLNILSLYGMSECTGPHSFQTPDSWCHGSVGKVFDGVQPVIGKGFLENEGEVCMQGRHVFMGYLDEEAMTKEALDQADGLLHSGDIGREDDSGILWITGRIKELIITAGAENIPPVPIEDNLKEFLGPLISNCMVIGDQRKFLSVLLALKVTEDGNLTPEALGFLQKNLGHSLSSCKLSDLVGLGIQNKNGIRGEVYKVIQSGVERANDLAISNAHRINAWYILPADFTVPTGELGPTLKLKRSVVTKKYSDVIEEIYSSSSRL